MLTYFSANTITAYTKNGFQGEMLYDDGTHKLERRQETIQNTNTWVDSTLLLNYMCNRNLEKASDGSKPVCCS